MYYYDYEDKPRHTYPGRNIVLGVQAVLIMGIVFFGMLALEDASGRTPSNSASYFTMSVEPANRSDIMQLYSLGLNYKRSGDYAASVEMYTRAIAIEPSFSWLYLNRGVVYETIGDEARADTDFWQFMRTHVDEMRNYGNYEIGERITIAMRDRRLVSFPFSASAGDMFTFRAEARDTVHTDPLIVVIDDQGNVIAGQDDTFMAQGEWVSMDASLPYLVIPEDCTNCQLVVGHAGGGAEGLIDVVITPHSVATGDECSDPYGY